ncbi:GlxA family transcriptional regulator [Jiella pelagia]|uniref:GlxA family transcriptional regulator n=1 Tax=Jiella pelagia TaxID=2986949 RepID=A0ABY7C0P3_9HYPH|nr:GlxA family transcriptional regulator [Jiella pelagia]WAP68338.1 GlxA family transcriptional regulator [Jiella pelagia]
MNEDARVSDARCQTIGFVLLPGFALMSFAAASEPLRAANILAGRPVYAVECFSAAGGPARASSGAIVETRPLREAGGKLFALLVCAGGEPRDWQDRQLPTELRRLARSGLRLGGISGGAYVLAEAGLLARRTFTIHWEHAAALKEAFPDLDPTPSRYVIDRDRLTCGGGVAPLDMMHALIAERMGPAFARRVSDWFLHTAIGEAAGPQRGSVAERYGTHHPALVAALERLESAIETPPSRAELARLAGVSPRQLQRLFASHLGRGIVDVSQEIRLAEAMRLLRQSPLSIAEIAVATGFANASHFARAVRAATGQTPTALRKAGTFLPVESPSPGR